MQSLRYMPSKLTTQVQIWGTMSLMELFEHRPGVTTHWVSFENLSTELGKAGLENQGAKGHAFDAVLAGQTVTLMDAKGSGTITRMWLTIDDRSAAVLRCLRLDIYWDESETPAVSVPLGDFFCASLGRCVPFETPLFSNPEGRSFNCFVPMPFRTAARVTITNESDQDLLRLFYDIDFLLGVQHSPDTLYFHSHWRRENPNALGSEVDILPTVQGRGRFLGACMGVGVDRVYDGCWWGEGEVKVRFNGMKEATLCGSGTEDYIGSGWGQGTYNHRTQGCLVADKDASQYVFYRFHLDDPVFFDGACQVSIQAMGGSALKHVRELMAKGAPLIPVTIDPGQVGAFVQLLDGQEHDLTREDLQEGWCNYWRQDDWSVTSYFYLDAPASSLPPLPPLGEWVADLPTA